jgi:hypothetical protein
MYEFSKDFIYKLGLHDPTAKSHTMSKTERKTQKSNKTSAISHDLDKN